MAEMATELGGADERNRKQTAGSETWMRSPGVHATMLHGAWSMVSETGEEFG